nr:MAG TPA: hypothetical protein [Caudoviricetes sp.]
MPYTTGYNLCAQAVFLVQLVYLLSLYATNKKKSTKFYKKNSR